MPAVAEVLKSRDLPEGTRHTMAETGFKSRFPTLQGLPFPLLPNWQPAETLQATPPPPPRGLAFLSEAAGEMG